MEFDKFKFEEKIYEALDLMNFKTPTPVQQKAIPQIINGKDIIACAQTGTGKTAAFVLPILDKLLKRKKKNSVNTIIITPTRELAKQIDTQIEGFAYFTNNSSYAIYGGGTGVEYERQKQAIINGTEIIICTPGRLLSHLEFNYFDTTSIKHIVLDEADKMLDMGFYNDIIKIINKFPKNSQKLLFSATMPNKIRKLANKILNKPSEISISISKPASGITQSAYMVIDQKKINLISYIFKKRKTIDRILIFASSIKNVKEINKLLKKIKIKSAEMHSGLSQVEREETIRKFKNDSINVLVATDILSRGIDIKNINLVINYEVPFDPEDYIHRIGRTARAQKKGEAITFINKKQIKLFKNIEKIIEKKIETFTY
mgnify:FL=1|tara:strand:- start:3284 stop:4402 length:1119 start_codon:yes stop_codon:yes gene_type:complete